MRLAAFLLGTAMMFGQSIADPYHFLEDAKSPKTKAWVQAQNTAAETALDAYAGGKIIASRVRQLSLTGPQQYEPQIAGGTLFYMREVPPAPQPVLVAQPWPSGTPHVVLDPGVLGPAVSIDFVWPAPNGKLIAIGTSSGGGEATTIRLVDTSGHIYRDALGPAGGGTTGPVVAWDPNSRGFMYGRLPANGSQFGIKLYHHTVGSAQAADTLSLGETSPIAEYSIAASSDARSEAALAEFGDGSFDRVYMRTGSRWHPALESGGVISGAYAGSTLLLIATAGTPNGRVAALQKDGSLRTIVREERHWALHHVDPIRGGFLLTKSWGTTWRVDHYSDSGEFIRTVALPRSGIGIRGIASDDTQDRAIITYSGYAGPVMRWVAYDGRSAELRTIYDLEPKSPAYKQIRVSEITARSKDGTAIPVTVLSLPGTPQNGTAPAILTGYGGFRISIAPGFIGSNLAWLQMGGVYAIANLRGGSEFGERWHQEGMLTNKQNVFDDFYAAAQALVQSKWTSPTRLGIEGGSNGGLLVGAALIQHPKMYRAVVGFAGIYDTLRHQVFPNGAYNVSEYGSVSNEQQFHSLYAYSPYHHVDKGTAYPAVLLVTSENDPRVAPWQSWKFGAALEAATSSKRPVLVLTHSSGGHGHGASFAQRVGDNALMLSFMAQQLGADVSRLR